MKAHLKNLILCLVRKPTFGVGAEADIDNYLGWYVELTAGSVLFSRVEQD